MKGQLCTKLIIRQQRQGRASMRAESNSSEILLQRSVPLILSPSTVSFSNSHLSPWVMDRRLPVGRKGPVSVGWMWGPQDAGVSVWDPERGQRGPRTVCRGRSGQGAPSPHRLPSCVATTQGFYPVPTPGNGHCLPRGLLVAVPENQSLIALCSSPPVRLSKPRNRNTGPGR